MTIEERNEKIRSILTKLKELGCLPSDEVDDNSTFCLALGLDQEREKIVNEVKH